MKGLTLSDFKTYKTLIIKRVRYWYNINKYINKTGGRVGKYTLKYMLSGFLTIEFNRAFTKIDS